MYKLYETIDLKEAFSVKEERVLEYWKKHNIPQRSIDEKDPNKQFVFYEGPPTANGKPGIHHVISRALKDFTCRYKTMNGYQVKRKAGWDTHGLPVEIEVEKNLGINGKQEIEKYGIKEFNQKCRNSVFSYEKEWRKLTERIAFWLDMDHPYITLDNNYVESVWWLMKQIYDKGLIYQGFKILPYCPRCGTPLSSHEVSLGYKTTKDPSIYIRMKVKNNDNLYFLVWTTTPWTLLSNVAVALNPDNKYVTIKYKDDRYILAKSRLSALFKKDEYEIIEEKLGKEYEGIEYEPLFTYAKINKKAFYSVVADYVTLDDGTGIVHIAPAFGEEDYAVGRKYDLPVVQLVDDEGKFKEEVELWKGMFVKDADPLIMTHLKERGILLKKEKIEHTYPFCWRCHSPLLYYARKSWYIKTTEYKDKLIENNKKIKWYPPYVGEGRFGQWLENNIDWAVSRNRYWGTPLNIWICDNCGHEEAIGSIKELQEKVPSVPDDIDLHRPAVDDIKYTCPKCGKGTMVRTPEVLDCWFDSGAMPYAQWHYPFENKEVFEKSFPADFICEGIDQTRGWFYSLLAISTLVSGEPSYKTCLVTELILDEKGEKMSKSKGNIVEPWEVINKYGVDAIRWYLYTVSPPWAPTKFDVKGVSEITRKFLGTLYSTYSFFAMYINIDKYEPVEIEDISDYPEIDKWILSKLHNLIKKVHDWNEEFELTRSTRAIDYFVMEDLSNWYIRRSRRRFWQFTLTDDKKKAYNTLNHILHNLSKLIAPFVPFAADDLYLKLHGKKDSVHLESYPIAKMEFINEKLEREMDLVRNIVYLGRAARNKVRIKVRQPLSTLFVPEIYKEIVSPMEELIKEEINIKDVKYISNKDEIVNYEIKLKASSLGPKYGKLFPKIVESVREIEPLEIVQRLRKDKEYLLTVHQHEVKLIPDDVDIRFTEKEKYVIEIDNSISDIDANFIALHIELTDDLINEGYARELVNKIQYQRKHNDFDIMDRIEIEYFADEEIDNVFEAYKKYISGETLADNIMKAEKKDDTFQEWNINGKKVALKLTAITK